MGAGQCASVGRPGRHPLLPGHLPLPGPREAAGAQSAECGGQPGVIAEQIGAVQPDGLLQQLAYDQDLHRRVPPAVVEEAGLPHVVRVPDHGVQAGAVNGDVVVLGQQPARRRAEEAAAADPDSQAHQTRPRHQEGIPAGYSVLQTLGEERDMGRALVVADEPLGADPHQWAEAGSRQGGGVGVGCSLVGRSSPRGRRQPIADQSSRHTGVSVPAAGATVRQNVRIGRPGRFLWGRRPTAAVPCRPRPERAGARVAGGYPAAGPGPPAGRARGAPAPGQRAPRHPTSRRTSVQGGRPAAGGEPQDGSAPGRADGPVSGARRSTRAETARRLSLSTRS